MKKLACAILAILLSLPSALCLGESSTGDSVTAEAVERWMKSASLQELYSMRDALNDAISSLLTDTANAAPPIEGKTLREIFPCLTLAKLVRDEAGMVSVDQVPTQEQLANVTSLSCTILSNEKVTDLTGISFLSQLRRLEMSYCKELTTLPDELCSLENLTYLDFTASPIASLPAEIGNLTNLEYLLVGSTKISYLPDSICNCVNLMYLIAQESQLSSLPDNIGNLASLIELDISSTQITSLPSSIYSLSLKTFNKEGLPIE